MCIPYEGNEHLLGTSDNQEKKWTPKKGEVVAVSDNGFRWRVRIVKDTNVDSYPCIDTDGNYWLHCAPLKEHFPEAFILEEN